MIGNCSGMLLLSFGDGGRQFVLSLLSRSRTFSSISLLRQRGAMSIFLWVKSLADLAGDRSTSPGTPHVGGAICPISELSAAGSDLPDSVASGWTSGRQTRSIPKPQFSFYSPPVCILTESRRFLLLSFRNVIGRLQDISRIIRGGLRSLSQRCPCGHVAWPRPPPWCYV